MVPPRFDRRAERSTGRYQKARLGFLKKHPLCAECGRQGITKAATDLDHIIPVRDAPDRFWDRTNWQPLCRECHEAKTVEENQEPDPDPPRASVVLEGGPASVQRYVGGLLTMMHRLAGLPGPRHHGMPWEAAGGFLPRGCAGSAPPLMSWASPVSSVTCSILGGASPC